MTIKVSESLEPALIQKASSRGMSLDSYVQKLLEQDLGITPEIQPVIPFEDCRGILAKYGPAPSAEDIDANNADIWRNFGENF